MSTMWSLWFSRRRAKSCARLLLFLGLGLTTFALPVSAQQTLFTTQAPELTNACDGSEPACTSYELGMKFQSSVNGQISAIRFFKATGETGSHVGTIWSSNGTPLASTPFTGETASGWQQQALSSPLNISANTTYVVSVNVNSHYVVTNSGPFLPFLKPDAGLFFPVVNGALTSLADDHNGTFGDSGTFPTQTFEFSNYFRDVVFTPASGSTITQPMGCLQKLVSVDGGVTFAAYPNFGSPATAQANTPVEFKLVVTNCGANVVTPSVIDDCINANPQSPPFACAPASAGGQGAPGLILYEPSTPVPSSPPIGVGASVTYDKALLPKLLVTPTDFAALCQTALTLTGKSVVRNDVEFDGTDANGAVSYEADAFVMCPTSAPITSNCVAINAIVNVPITPVTLTATGGVGPPYTFTGAGLPPGLSISPSGTISGTPTVSGTFNYTVTITDSAGNTGTLNCSVTVSPPTPPTSTCIVINATQGVAITPVTLTATGGAGGPYTFTATGLPAGLSISSSGTISGTPTVSGTFNYTVTITDSAGNKGTLNCSITVPPQGKSFSIGPSSMEGDLHISPGDWISGGYDFKFVSGSHPATAYTVVATVTVPVVCPDNSVQNIIIPLGAPGQLNGGGASTFTYNIPAGDTSKHATGDANSILSWDGAVQAPANLCGGNVGRNQKGAIFNVNVSQNPPAGLVDWQFKYRDPNAKGKGNVNCTDASDSRRNDAATCGASWSATLRDP